MLCEYEVTQLCFPDCNRYREPNRECSQVRMVDTISQPGCAECGAGGLVLTDYRPYAFLRALFLGLLLKIFNRNQHAVSSLHLAKSTLII